MTFEIAIVLVVIGAAVVLFVTEKLSIDLVALLAVAVLVLTRVLTPEEAVSGFSNQATVTIAAMFVLSAGLDEILNDVKNAVRAADVMNLTPDVHVSAMADLLLDGVRHLGDAFRLLGDKDAETTTAADAAVKCERLVEREYRAAMGDLFSDGDLRDAIWRRELYDRLIATSERMRMVAERVWYAVVKEA